MSINDSLTYYTNKKSMKIKKYLNHISKQVIYMKLAIIIILITSLIISTILGIIDSYKKFKYSFSLTKDEFEKFLKDANELDKIFYD